jgi:hypothetical protein
MAAKSNYAIPSLDQQQEKRFNLMMPGPGIPWEDRGGLGMVRAFFKTCWMALRHPLEMVDHIRRPETGHDVTLFSVGIAAIWMVSAAMHGVIRYYYWTGEEARLALLPNVTRPQVDGQRFMTYSALAAAGAAFGIILFHRVGSRLFYQMVGWAMTSKAPPVLTFNIFGYCLGTTILVLIPFAGAPLAAVWLLITLIATTRARMKIKTREAVTGTLILWMAAVVIVVGIYFIAKWFFPSAITYELHGKVGR